MSRAPVAAFVALVVATIAAFFITQHLKVSTPLIAGTPAPVPDAINPAAGQTCFVSTPRGRRRLDFGLMKISFYLQNRSDDVNVYIVDQNGNVVRTLATDTFMRGGAHPKRTQFIWNGRLDNGSIAPAGRYYVRVWLIEQARSIVISDPAGPEPVKVIRVPPNPIVTQVTPTRVAAGGIPVAIHYRGTANDRAFIQIYRADAPGSPRLVKTFAIKADSHEAIWNGQILHRPAPAGSYLIALQAIDAACDSGYFPARRPPAPPLPPQALLTVG